jgi:AraC family transcriptional regulator
MKTNDVPICTPSRFEARSAFILAGYRRRYAFEDMGEIPAQWAEFSPRIDDIPAKADQATYGVVISTPDQKGFDYMSACEVSDTSGLPDSFATLEFPAQRYAVFSHPGPLATMCETIDAIFTKWLPASGQEITGNPDFLERYGEAFDPNVGAGDIEIWVPVR